MRLKSITSGNAHDSAKEFRLRIIENYDYILDHIILSKCTGPPVIIRFFILASTHLWFEGLCTQTTSYLGLRLCNKTEI